MPVSLIVQNRSARLDFVLDLVFNRILGLTVQVIDEIDVSPPGPKILYGTTPQEKVFLIHDSGLLWERGKSFNSPVIKEENGLQKLFFDEEFDLFSAVFWMVTEYENYLQPTVDHHGRYTLSAVLQKLDLASQPIVHLWVAAFENQLLAEWPELRAEQRKPENPHQITFDLDNPWKYLHKPLWVQMGGLVKAIVGLRFTDLRERVTALIKREDPNDTIEAILEACPPEYTTFFILLENLHPNDSRFTWRHQRWRRRIKEIANRKYPVGIHPSYLASEIKGQIQQEKNYLEEIIGQPASSTRMHFLRYKLPSTRREMIEAGIREDYTPYVNGSGGFPNGMMIPYPWFDLEANETTELILIPTILMDRTMVGTPAAPRFDDQKVLTKEFLRLLSTIVDGNGAFVLCLHNECFSESGEWKNWSSWFAEIIRILTENNEGGRS